MSLLERDDQLLGLEAALEEAGHGMGATVLVSGEAGIGTADPDASFHLASRRPSS
jgi:predicted ATPase